jgi:hypothetical protein
VNILKAHYGIPIQEAFFGSYEETLEGFLEQPSLKIPFLYDPAGKLIDAVRKVEAVFYEYSDALDVTEPREMIPSFFSMRLSFEEMINHYRYVSTTILQHMFFAVLILLAVTFGTVFLIVCLVFYPLLRDMQNLGQNRRSCVYFKELKAFKLKNRSVKES